jgi:hypothetical protein
MSAEPVRIEVDGATARSGLVLHATYGAQLVGTVVDSNGVPTPNAPVTLRSYLWSWDTKTDDSGRFRFFGFKSGPYQIEVAWRREASKRYSVDLRADTRLDVELVTEPSSIAGTVVDFHGRPVKGIEVNAGGYFDRSDDLGHFEIAVPSGEYWASLSSRGTVVAHERLHTGTHDARPVMPGTTKISGRVTYKGAPVHAFVVHVNYPFELISSDNHLPSFPRIASTDGRFTIDGVFTGLRSIIIAGDDFPSGQLEVEIPEGDSFDLGDVDVDALDRM